MTGEQKPGGLSSTPDHAGLCERLREQKIIDAFSTPLGPVKKVSTNPDGPEAAAAIERLVAALNAIADMCPATCETSLAHDMAQIACTALEGASDDR